jgi:hypothetical protein
MQSNDMQSNDMQSKIITSTPKEYLMKTFQPDALIIGQLNDYELNRLFELLTSESTYKEMQEFYSISQFMFNKKELHVEHLQQANILDFALEHNRSVVLHLILKQPSIMNLTVLEYVYLRRNYRLSDLFTKSSAAGNACAEQLFLTELVNSYGSQDERFQYLVNLAINGERSFYDDGNRGDEYKYIATNLNMVKRIVPEFLSVQTALEIWHRFDTTMREIIHEKDENILAYLQIV